jgi:predicted phosphohydrolase
MTDYLGLKVQLASDLHTEFRDGKNSSLDFLKSDADVLVVAGDLSIWMYLEDNIKYLCDMFPEVVYVAGNHEYYHSNFGVMDRFFTKMKDELKNFHWLNDNVVTIGEQRFLGATLWFEENYETKNRLYQESMQDFYLIKNCDPLAFYKHDSTVRFLKRETKEGDMVVTHHMPSYRSIPPRFERSVLNCYFANHLDDLIRETKPAYWFFGHTHSCCRFRVGKTWLLCNPLGYPREDREDSLFEEVFTIDV